MYKHEAGPSCQACNDKLTRAHPDLRAWYLVHVKPGFPDCHISWSNRGKADQESAVAEGKSQLVWPKSPHNKMVNGLPLSDALDLFQLVDGKAKFPVSWYREIAKLATPGMIKWGGHWKSLSDFDHFQRIDNSYDKKLDDSQLQSLA